MAGTVRPGWKITNNEGTGGAPSGGAYPCRTVRCRGASVILTTSDGGRTTLPVPGEFAMTNKQPRVRSCVGGISGRTINNRGAAASGFIEGWCLPVATPPPSPRSMLAETDDRWAVRQQGTGKTTTALALARNGLRLAGDDALVAA